MAGHNGYLFGEKRMTGWWYYFPVVATYKVPLGIAAVLLLGLISIGWEHPRWAEWGLLIPCVAWGRLVHDEFQGQHRLPPLPARLSLRPHAGEPGSRPSGYRLVPAAWAGVAAAGVATWRRFTPTTWLT